MDEIKRSDFKILEIPQDEPITFSNLMSKLSSFFLVKKTECISYEVLPDKEYYERAEITKKSTLRGYVCEETKNALTSKFFITSFSRF